MIDDRFSALEAVPRGSKDSANVSHLVYSRRWQYLGGLLALLGLGSASTLLTSQPPRWAKPMLGGLFATGATAAGLGVTNIWRLAVERHSLRLPHWPSNLNGFKIAQLSDLHLGPNYSQHVLRQALATIKQWQPDIIVLTGDFVNRPSDVGTLEHMLTGINAPLGVYACLGNHDYWDDPQLIARTLSKVGVDVLLNQHRVVHWREQAIVIAGVTDPWQADADLELALHNAPAAPIILLAHGPDFADTAAQHKVALQLSGHAHAGHINAPWLGPLVVPRWGEKYPHGRFLIDQCGLYVSRGLAGLPIRFGATPEVGLLSLFSA
ncbi:metallophosphoesterase [Herpetosiphon geysericola]|uniref:metallophosphoesterase n=1 Tax=Herpetosiphon geysericola TaxID=70996 RepID=UPI0006C8F40B|nr:metallophosphoesterase [Herpetosiphon geysericola]